MKEKLKAILKVLKRRNPVETHEPETSIDEDFVPIENDDFLLNSLGLSKIKAIFIEIVWKHAMESSYIICTQRVKEANKVRKEKNYFVGKMPYNGMSESLIEHKLRETYPDFNHAMIERILNDMAIELEAEVIQKILKTEHDDFIYVADNLYKDEFTTALKEVLKRNIPFKHHKTVMEMVWIDAKKRTLKKVAEHLESVNRRVIEPFLNDITADDQPQPIKTTSGGGSLPELKPESVPSPTLPPASFKN